MRPPKRLFDHGGLLEDLLEHEMLVAALLGRRGVPRHVDDVAHDRRAVVTHQAVAVAVHHGHLALLEDDLAARVRQNRRRIGGDVHLAFADPDDQRACAVAREDQTLGLVARDDAERVGAAHFGERLAHGVFEIVFVVVHLDEMREHFGVGLAFEGVTDSISRARSGA